MTGQAFRFTWLRHSGQVTTTNNPGQELCTRRSGDGDQTRSTRIAYLNVDGFIVASRAAGLAIHQPIDAQPYIKCRLAENAEFLASATVFRTLALGTYHAAGAGFRRHELSLVRRKAGKKHNRSHEVRCQVLGFRKSGPELSFLQICFS